VNGDRRMRERRTGGKGDFQLRNGFRELQRKSPSVNQMNHGCVLAGSTNGGDPAKGLPRYEDINDGG
jgi:hypothetical protein